MSDRVMILEDDVEQARLLVLFLESLGYLSPVVCASGEEAIAQLDINKPALYLVDIVLSGEQDGVAVARLLREKHTAPLIFVSAYSDEEKLEAAANVDADGYLVKPYSLDSLRAAIAIAKKKFSVTSSLYAVIDEKYHVEFSLMDENHRLQTLHKALELQRRADVNLIATRDIDGFCRQIISDLMLLTQARYGAFGVFDEQGQMNKFLTEGLNTNEYDQLKGIPSGKGLLYAVYHGNTVVNIPEIGAHLEAYHFPPGHPPMKSLLGIPLTVAGSTKATIYLTDKQGGELFTENDVNILKLYAGEAEHVLEREALLHNLDQRNAELLRREDRLKRQNADMLEFAAQNNLSVTDYNTSAELIISKAVHTLGLAQAGIWLFNEDRSALECDMLYQAMSKRFIAGAVIKRSQCPVYIAAIEQHRVVVADDALHDPTTAELATSSLVPFGIGALLDVPIWLNGTIGGVVSFEHAGSERHWHMDEQNFASAVAEMISNLLELREQEHVQRELQQQLQDSHQQLLQSEKMASIGQLAAGVAHEINNPVGYVSSNLTTLQEYVENLFELLEGYEQMEQILINQPQLLAQLQVLKQRIELDYLKQDIVDLLQESRDGLTRVKQIVQDLKDFSHVDEAEWQWADLRRGLESTLNIVNNELKYKADVIRDYSDLPAVECIPSQLNQVFMNLLVNGAHAIEQHGTITIRTGLEGEDKVWVEIRDSGHGISAEHMKRIFDPFFTTKPVGKGTGLGLSLTYGIIERHKGTILVDSVPGQGTAFKVILPIRQESPKASE